MVLKKYSLLNQKYFLINDVDGRDKVSQKWSFKNEPP